jgi:flavin reductase
MKNKGLAMPGQLEMTVERGNGTSMTAFVNAMSRAVSGVSIVTTDGPSGRFGITVSSMVSVSAEPPMLLICVNRSSVAHDAIRDNGVFAINVLTSRQQCMANQFAGRRGSGRPYQFARRFWVLDEAIPRLRAAAASFHCELESATTFGSHSVIVGRVGRSHAGQDTPLLYTGRDYGRPVRLN